MKNKIATTNYITKIALTTLLAILVMSETSTWYGIIKMNFKGYSKYNIITAIIEIILYVTIVTMQTINYIIEIKNIKQ